MFKRFIFTNLKSFAGITALAAWLVGIVLLPFGIVSVAHDQSFRAHARVTESISITQVLVPRTNRATRIRFQYRVGPHVYVAQEAGPGYGLKLTNQPVLYDPANPSHAILEDPHYGTAGMALGLSIFFLLLGGIILGLKWIWQLWRRRSGNP